MSATRPHRRPAPQTPYQAVLAAAADLPYAEDALAAELIGSALLGSVYALSTPDRLAATVRFVHSFARATTGDDTAALARAVFATLAGEPSAPAAALPGWAAGLGAVRPTRIVGYGDADVTGLAASFAYVDPAHGPPHTVVVLADRHRQAVRESFVIRSADDFQASLAAIGDAPEGWRAEPAADELVVAVREAVAAVHLRAEPPAADLAGPDWLLACRRLAALGTAPPLP